CQVVQFDLAAHAAELARHRGGIVGDFRPAFHDSLRANYDALAWSTTPPTDVRCLTHASDCLNRRCLVRRLAHRPCKRPLRSALSATACVGRASAARRSAALAAQDRET